MTFRTVVLLGGKTATGLRIPAEVVEALGAGQKPAVHVTVNGYAYRSTIAVRGGEFLIPLSAENRTAAGVSAGEEVDVDLVLDTQPRTVEIPADLAAALADEPAAKAFLDGLSYSHQRAYTQWIEDAKKDETRARRVGEAVAMLRDGRRRD